MTPFSELRFRYPLRRYQQMILDVVAGQPASDHKYHIVAPPGAGKTIVGLELIRRLGRPAVVFAPTTTIQRQWREKVDLFAEDPAWIDRHVSLDARHLRDISVLTYQVLATPGQNLAFVERIATERWVDDLLSSDRARTDAEARERVATLQSANPKAYRRELSKRYRRVKREFLREGGMDGKQFLHPNARALIERIAGLGTGIIVLDECHHLLDYWAFILGELVRTLPDVRLVGLTATLPDPSNQTQYENYTSLLGDVDFEVPTPAVVKEGNLAPYRDLVYFCEPSAQEQSYLEGIQRHFEKAVWQVSNTPAFRDWLWNTLFPGFTEMDNPVDLLGSFESAFNREPLLCIAAVKYLLEQGVSLPLSVPIIEEMLEPLAVDDWLILMENYALRALKISANVRLQTLYKDLCEALLPFGITVSERGIRHQRSPSDLVLALSESKCRAVVDILRAESASMESKLRAVVLTDFERMSARTRKLKNILDPNAGSAVLVFRYLVAHPATALLAPVLVSGKVVLISARMQTQLDEGIRRWVEDHQAKFDWEWRKTQSDDVLRMAGSGPDWSSRTYVALVTDLFECGLTRCLVGTRGIFGEGWDALKLNTMIDLTSVTASTSVQQIRGRTIRLDPAWSRKVAHNWDVVCVSRIFDKGDADLRRFVARHDHVWGIATRPTPEGFTGELKRGVSDHRSPQSIGVQSLESDPVSTLHKMEGRVVRGVAHVDLGLAVELATRGFQQVSYRGHTRHMLDAVWDRDQVYDMWAVGQSYENQAYSVSRVEDRDIKFHTTRAVRGSLRAVTRHLLISLASVGGAAWLSGAVLIPWAELHALVGIGAASVALTSSAALAAVILNARGIVRVFRHSFLDLPADDILMDMGHALLAALRDTGAVDAHLPDSCVRVAESGAGGYEIFLAADVVTDSDSLGRAGPLPVESCEKDADTFAHAYRQMMGPLGDARYLIERDSSSLRNPAYRSMWFMVRRAMKLDEELKAYHRVPDVLASRRERADVLAQYWRQYVGGGRLVYTRTAEGRRILLQARAQNREPIQQMAFQVWR